MSFAEQFVRYPHSARIAREINERGGVCCAHGRSPCVLQCGTYWNVGADLVCPIPHTWRLDWLARVAYLTELKGRTPEEARAACQADGALVALVGLSRLTEAWQDGYTPLSARLRMREVA